MNRIIRVLDYIPGAFSEIHSKNFYAFRKFLDENFIPNNDNGYRLEEPFYTCLGNVIGYAKGKMTIFPYHTGDSDERIGESLLSDAPKEN